MPKVIRFHTAHYHNAYGYFEKDSVYTDVPDDLVLPGGAEEISKDDIEPLDNVRTKNYDGLTTSGITKQIRNAKEARKAPIKDSLKRRPEATKAKKAD